MIYLLPAAIFFVALGAVWRLRTNAQLRDSERERVEAEALRATAQAEAHALRLQAQAQAKENQLKLRENANTELSNRTRDLQRREDQLNQRARAFAAEDARVIAKRAALDEHEQKLRAIEGSKKLLDQERNRVEEERSQKMEEIAGERRVDIRERLQAEWIEEAKAAAADELRRIGENATGIEHMREAKRVMGIAVQRYEGHYLTERLISNLPLDPPTLERVIGPNQQFLGVIEGIANVKLLVNDEHTGIRLDGQDSFGREIARRAISRFGKHGVPGQNPDEAKRITEEIRVQLEREVYDLGKKAFNELRIPKAHDDIVRLVGRLNWRTSYTQNQWKHAIEAAFLCGMMADEMGLDVKLARRAALMHDIGKALTHTIDGSHAVIGADYARRLGEKEVVANAIGAHHTEEPFNSVYALLVAASDAMSGARPGARREQSDNYIQRVEDLERIGGRMRGVERAFAVQGGRELRIYVEQERVSDEGTVELSTQVAKQVSDELTFPGQIRVTVIREFKAVETAS